MTTLIAVPGHHHENLEDEFWAEAALIDRIEDEEQKGGNVTDEEEADWLSEVGLGEWTQQWRQGKSLPENDIGRAVQKLSLKPHQAEAVRRRVRTLNATLKKKKHHRRPPDVRSFFQNEINDNKDSSSRSATPDSLDSNDFLNSDSPPRRNSSPNILDHPNSRSNDELDDLVPQLPNVPTFVSIFAHEQQHFQQQINSASPPSRNKDIFKPRFQVRGSSNPGVGEIATDAISGVEMLNYHNVGTIYMKGYIPCRIRNNASEIMHSSPLSLPNQSVNSNVNSTEINSRTFSAFVPQKSGFTQELNRRNGNAMTDTTEDNEDLVEEDTYIDPCGLTKLSDLSEEDVKNIRPLLLMELTAQCDHMNIQVRRKKVHKTQKKNSMPNEDSNGIFGVSLDTLLAKDRQVSGDHQLEVPIVFDKLVSHLSRRSLSEEGLLRMAGHKGKIHDLRATFESSLYSEPEQVDAAMNQVSSHDVANLLKQFLRELPIPLLGFEYIDTFFDVAGQMKERSQENSLRLLVLLLPLSHQAVLRMLLQLLRDLVKNSECNKMSLKNVALIVAPNLVPSSALRSQDTELSRAATWVKLTQTLVKYGSSLFYTPSDLVSQLRQINDTTYSRNKKAKGKQHVGGGKVGSSMVSSSPSGGPNAKGCSPCSNLLVSAPQLGFPEVILPVGAGTTAGDICLQLLDEADRKAEDLEREAMNNNNLNARRRAGPRITPNGPNLSCLLTQVNRDTALKAHSLYEIGGNIGYRRVDPSALVPAICRDNPSATWVLKCNHRHSTADVLRRN